MVNSPKISSSKWKCPAFSNAINAVVSAMMTTEILQVAFEIFRRMVEKGYPILSQALCERAFVEACKIGRMSEGQQGMFVQMCRKHLAHFGLRPSEGIRDLYGQSFRHRPKVSPSAYLLGLRNAIR